jgi:hypothetical protein
MTPLTLFLKTLNMTCGARSEKGQPQIWAQLKDAGICRANNNYFQLSTSPFLGHYIKRLSDFYMSTISFLIMPSKLWLNTKRNSKV